CLDAGMDDYVSKPVKLEELQSVLERWHTRAPLPAGGSPAVPECGDAEEPVDRRTIATLRELQADTAGGDVVAALVRMFLEGARGSRSLREGRMKILIAEDDSASRLLLEATLKKLGHEVIARKNGSQALVAFQTEEVHCVISDWMMPEMDGLQLSVRIRGEQR